MSSSDRRKRIFVISPLRARDGRSMDDHLKLFWSLCREVALMGHAPFGPHGFYTHFLDDSIPEERAIGIDCGLAYLAGSDEAWVWTAFGVEGGMAQEVAAAKDLGIPIYTPPTWAPLLVGDAYDKVKAQRERYK